MRRMRRYPDVLAADAQPRPSNSPVPDKARRHVLGGVDGRCKAQPLGPQDDCSGHANDFAVRGDQRSARVAGVERGVRLNHVVNENTGDLCVNLDTKTVEVNGARVHLTGKEYQMLELLSLRKGTTLTKEMFLNHLYGGMDEPELCL